MARRAGSADLPLHGGHVPRWLADRMTRLGAVTCEAIVHHYGRDELLRRLAHPFWFQSFGAVMGMDSHSSGITTSVIDALKRGLRPLAAALGIHVCGGRGMPSRQTPHALIAIAGRAGRRPFNPRSPNNSCCHTLLCRRITRSARATCSSAAYMAPWLPRRTADPWIFPSCY